MTREEIISILANLKNTRFAEAAGMLADVIALDGTRISLPNRAVPGTELRDIYAARRDLHERKGRRIPGLSELVDMLNEYPNANWRMFGISHGVLFGVIFVSDVGGHIACIAGKKS